MAETGRKLSASAARRLRAPQSWGPHLAGFEATTCGGRWEVVDAYIEPDGAVSLYQPTADTGSDGSTSADAARAIAEEAARQALLGVADAIKKAALEPHEPPPPEANPAPLPDDALVHQDSIRIPDRDAYLRLARRGAFPSRKQGKKVLAAWGDVKAALGPPPASESPGLRKAKPKPGPQQAQDDGLDEQRRKLGLAPKGGK